MQLEYSTKYHLLCSTEISKVGKTRGRVNSLYSDRYNFKTQIKDCIQSFPNSLQSVRLTKQTFVLSETAIRVYCEKSKARG